jgi:hypothetical protein
MVVSALVNREAWWARLSPQIYLVPLILLAAMAMCASTWVRRIAGVLVILLLCNSALVAALSLGRAAEKSWMFRQRMAQLRAFSTSGPLQVTAHPSFRMITEHRLRSWSIVFERAATPPCSAPFAFSYPLSTQALACPIQSR